MVVGGVALVVLAYIVGYLVMEDRELTREFRSDLLSTVSELKSKVERLEIQSALCDCKLPSR